MLLSRSGLPFSTLLRDALRHGAVAGLLVSGGLLAIGAGHLAASFDTVELWEVGPEFEAEAELHRGSAGGLAFELDADHPASVLRLEPSDRRCHASATEGRDYFLEQNARRAGPTAGDTIEVVAAPRGEADTLVYVVDGNLWLDNRGALTIALGSPAREVAFVVHGDIFIADDFVVETAHTDVTFYAVGEGETAGNIHVGDTWFGTLERVDANLIASGEVSFDGGATADLVNGRIATHVPLH